MDEGQQTKHIGLIETLVRFAQTFSKIPAESMHTQKKRTVFFSPEEEYWVCMVINNPMSGTEYLEADLDDTSLQAALRQVYRLFKLFNGDCTSVVGRSGYPQLRLQMTGFLNSLLPSLSFEQLNLFSTLEGMLYMPVDRTVYLNIQAFLTLLETSVRAIKYSVFLYRDQLVWNGLEQENMQTLYTYLFPRLEEALPRPQKSWRTRSPLVLPEVLSDSKPVDLPLVYLEGESEPLTLAIYQRQQVSCVLVIDPAVAKEAQFHRQLLDTISPHIDQLAPQLAEQTRRKLPPTDDYRFVYFNQMNLALKTSLPKRGLSIPRDVQRLLLELHSDFERSSDTSGEAMVKLSADGWVVARKSDRRELYVYVEARNANLIDVSEDIKKLSSTHFANIFIDWS
jgi:hypothetical protein